MTRVLVIEDDLISQEIAKRALQRFGIDDIACTSDGAAGLRFLDEAEPKPDLVICDIFLPEKDGLEIINALIDTRFKGGVIMVTGSDMQYLHVAKTMAVANGLNYLAGLSKPFSDEALASALSQLAKTN